MSFDNQPWTTPGVYEVAPGVHRVPLPMPNDGLRAVNVYLVSDGDGVVVIDSGWEVDEARDLLGAALAEVGYGWGDVHGFLITHMHRDHYTLAVLLRQEYGIPISLGAGERPSIEVILGSDDTRELGDLHRWGYTGPTSMAELGIDPGESRAIYELPDEWITGEQDFALHGRVLRALPTPGHTHGHTVFRDAEGGLLFAGDHVLPHITPSIGFEPVVVHSALGDYLNSLRLLLDYPDTVLLPAHGPVAPSVHTRVKELLAHHDERLAMSLETVRQGATTALESASALSWTRRGRRFSELNAFNQFLAMGETAAHLEHLADSGALERELTNGVALYRLA